MPELCQLRGIGRPSEGDAQLVSVIPEQFDALGILLTFPAIAVVFVPDLDPMPPGDEDDRIDAQGNRTTEKDPQLWIDLRDRDFVGFCHLPERGLDLPIYREKGLRDRLSGDPKVCGDRRIGYPGAPQLPELELFFLDE